MTDSYRVLWEEMTGAFAHLRRCVEATPGCSRADLCILLGQYITAEAKWLAERPAPVPAKQLPKEGSAVAPAPGDAERAEWDRIIALVAQARSEERERIAVRLEKDAVQHEKRAADYSSSALRVAQNLHHVAAGTLRDVVHMLRARASDAGGGK